MKHADDASRNATETCFHFVVFTAVVHEKSARAVVYSFTLLGLKII